MKRLDWDGCGGFEEKSDGDFVTFEEADAIIAAANREIELLRLERHQMLAALWSAAGTEGLRVPDHVMALKGMSIIARHSEKDRALFILREKPANIEVPGEVKKQTVIEHLTDRLEAAVTEKDRTQRELDAAVEHVGRLCDQRSTLVGMVVSANASWCPCSDRSVFRSCSDIACGSGECSDRIMVEVERRRTK